MEMNKKVYTIEEAANALCISKPKMYQLCKAAGFPFVRLGSRIVIPIAKLDQWLNEKAEAAIR